MSVGEIRFLILAVDYLGMVPLSVSENVLSIVLVRNKNDYSLKLLPSFNVHSVLHNFYFVIKQVF